MDLVCPILLGVHKFRKIILGRKQIYEVINLQCNYRRTVQSHYIS